MWLIFSLAFVSSIINMIVNHNLRPGFLFKSVSREEINVANMRHVA